METRQPVTPEQIEEARSGWLAYTALDPRVLESWLARRPRYLSFAQAALTRHLAYFPSARNGLGAVEEVALRALANGPRPFRQVFLAASDPLDGLTDLNFAALLTHLAQGDQPLLEVDSPLPQFDRSDADPVLALTPAAHQQHPGCDDRRGAAGGQLPHSSARGKTIARTSC